MAAPASFASASLYVGDLAPDVTEALLFEIFNAVGPVASVRVCRDASTRRSLGYAYVNYHRMEDAERALDTMNFKAIRNKACRIMWSHRDPSLRRSGKGNIFVKNLAPSIDNKALYDTFSLFGNILSCKVSTNAKGESLGYGFVHYEGEDAAQKAIDNVNGKEIAKKVVSVSAYKSKEERGGDKSEAFTNIYVKNIPKEFDENKLKELFAPFGEITSIKLALDDKGAPRGFGFVSYGKPEEAAAAVTALNENEVAPEKKLFVGRAQKKSEREKELREHYDKLKQERMKKFAGVNLYVKNLADSTTEDKLKEEFGAIGTITSAKVMVDSAGKSKGFGFVCYSSPEEAAKATQEMNGKMVDGKPLYVAAAQRKDQRRQQLQFQYGGGRKMGPGMGQQFQYGPGMPQPIYFPAGMPQRNVYYPNQQLQMRQWPQQGQQGPQQVNYQLMAVQPRQGGRGGRGGRQRKDSNVRNQRQRQQQPQQQQQELAQPQPQAASEPGALTTSELAAAPEEQRKQMIGERLFPLVKALKPEMAGKITGMLLEMDNGELLHLLESREALSEKVGEADMVLQEFATAQQGATQ